MLFVSGEAGVIGSKAPGTWYLSAAEGAVNSEVPTARVIGAGDEERGGTSVGLLDELSGGGGGESGSGMFVASGTSGKVSLSTVAVGSSSSKSSFTPLGDGTIKSSDGSM